MANDQDAGVDAASNVTGRAGVLRAFLKPPLHGSMTDAVTDALREAILSGVLAPPAWLREDELAKALAVSRTPVRDALRRLSDEGLTQKVANRGTQVAPMSLDNILAVYSVRESLEGLAARTAARKRPNGLVDELRDMHRRMEVQNQHGESIVELNLQFHRLIREASDNPYLERFLTQVEHAVRRFGRSTFEVAGRTEETLHEHFRIIEAIAAGDAERAEQCAVEHMRNARQVRVKQILGE
jgi:DNA-binding GntR family transcriptional regulator